jgi:hypothetical protein
MWSWSAEVQQLAAESDGFLRKLWTKVDPLGNLGSSAFGGVGTLPYAPESWS